MTLKEQKVDEIHKQLDCLVQDLNNFSNKGMRLDQVERHIFRSLLSLGFSLVNYYILLVGEIVHLATRPKDSQGKKMKNTGIRRRNYRSIFGLHQISRIKYYSLADKTHYELDKRLGLPRGVYSYVLSDWLAYGAVDLDFDQSAKQLQRILGQDLTAMQSSRVTYQLSQSVEDFYESKDWQGVEEGPCLSLGVDGKGIPIIRSQTDRATESVSSRLGRGKRRGVKKEATVSVSSSFTARKRSVSEIIDSLFNKEKVVAAPDQKSRPKWHEQKHMRAFLSNISGAIDYGLDNLLKRDPTATKPIVVLMDGDKALRCATQRLVKEKGIEHRVKAYILDFIHVLEYVWKVANAYLGEKSHSREQWVEQQARLLLNSRTDYVIEQWEKIAQLKKYSSTQTLNLKKAINYLKNHKDMLKYKTYLQRGYPITTGAVESACGHFVKSRMERNAMHWGKTGAQEMLNLRAVKKNGDWEDYLTDFFDKQQQKLYNLVA